MHFCCSENVILTVPYQKVPHLSIRANFAGKPFVRHVPIDISAILNHAAHNQSGCTTGGGGSWATGSGGGGAGQCSSSAASSTATSSSTQSTPLVVGGTTSPTVTRSEGGKTVHRLAAKSVIRDFERLALKELLHLAGK